MTIIVNANIYLHDPETSAVLALMSAKLDSISSQLGIVTATQSQEMDTMTKEFDALQAEVERGTAVDTSVVSLVQGLAAQIEASKDDPIKLQQLADSLRANNDAVAAAVTANTPAAPSADPATGSPASGGSDTGAGGATSDPNAGSGGGTSVDPLTTGNSGLPTGQ
jgi:hypothetical protein